MLLEIIGELSHDCGFYPQITHVETQMTRFAITTCLLLVSFRVGCNSQPQKIAQSDCDGGTELQWAGVDMCNQERDKQHTHNKPVTLSVRGCNGIHVKNDKDFDLRLDRMSKAGTGTCPANSSDNPFTNKFPYDSNGKPKEFHTGKVRDTNSIGCTYELYFTPKENPSSCDPHIALEQ